MGAFRLLLQLPTAGGAGQRQLPRASSYSSGASDLEPAEPDQSFDEAPGSPGSASSQLHGSQGSTGSRPSRGSNCQPQQRLADATAVGCRAGSQTSNGGQPGTGADQEKRDWQQLTEASHSFSGGKAGLDKWDPLQVPGPYRPAGAASSTSVLEAGPAEEPDQQPTAEHVGCLSSTAVQPHTIAGHQQTQQGAGNGTASSTAQTDSEPSHHSSSAARGRQADWGHNRSQQDSAHAPAGDRAGRQAAAQDIKRPVGEKS